MLLVSAPLLLFMAPEAADRAGFGMGLVLVSVGPVIVPGGVPPGIGLPALLVLPEGGLLLGAPLPPPWA